MLRNWGFDDDSWDDPWSFRSFPNRTFGLDIRPNEVRFPKLRQLPSFSQFYPRSWTLSRRSESREERKDKPVEASCNKDGFHVSLDVEHFTPNEITVKTVENTIIVEAKHEEKEDEQGYIYRHFIRRYQLPKEFDVKDVCSTLSSDGVLTIKAPPPTKAIEVKERVVPIMQTGPSHIVKEIEKEVQN